MDGVEGGNFGEVVVIGKGEELIAVFAIPSGNFVGSGIAVAIDGVGVEISLVPTGLSGLPGRADLGESDGPDAEGKQGEAEGPLEAHEN